MSYTNFFLNSPASVVELELLEISHPSFSKVYRIVRNSTASIVATIDSTPQTFDYYPLRITSKGTKVDLDYALQIDVGDLGDILPTELDLIANAGTFNTYPVVRYWVFGSDDLTTALIGPLNLRIENFSFTDQGASFEAKPPDLNVNRTGELYTLNRFPMLRGFL